MQKETHYRSQEVLFVFLASFPVVMALLCSPAFPNLELFFETSQQVGLKTMISYLLGGAIGFLLSGGLADHWGRVRVLRFGLCFALVFSLCGLVFGEQGNFSLFCFFRVMQGIACSTGVIAFLMLIDLYTHHVIKRPISSLLFLFIGLVTSSIGIGALCTEYSGWQGCFLFMIFYTAVLLLLTFRLPWPQVRNSSTSVRSLYLESKDPFLLLYGCIGGVTSSLIYFYAVFSPFIAIDRIGFTPIGYGFWSLVAFLGLFIGFYFSQHDLKTPRISLLGGIFYSLLGSIAMQVFFVNRIVNVYTLFFLAALILVAPALIYPKTVTVILRETTHKTAAFLMVQTMSFLIPSLILSILLFTHIGKKTLPLSCGVSSLLALLLWFGLRAHHAQKHK